MRLKKRNKLDSKICALTAYDYPTARILDELNVDMILVGDSLGMMVFGHEDTTNVSIEMMIHHTKACRNGVKNTPLITDMPYKSYETIDSALNNASNRMKFSNLPLNKTIKDDPEILAMVDSAIDRCNALNPSAKKDSHNHKNHSKKKSNRKFKKPPKAFDRKSNS